MKTMYDSVGQKIHVGDMVAHIKYGRYGGGKVEKGIVVGIGGKYDDSCEIMKDFGGFVSCIMSSHLVVMRERAKLSDYVTGMRKRNNMRAVENRMGV